MRNRSRTIGVLGSLCLAGGLGGCEQALGLDGIETYPASGTTTTGVGGTTSGTTGGGGQSTTTSTGGGTTSSQGGGGTAGTGGSGGTAGTGGTGGTGGQPTPTSCKEALLQGTTESGVVTIDPFGADPPMEVYCDQANMGGGWALVFSSVADPMNGATTGFWNIPYSQRFDVIAPAGATPTKNYYAGKLYPYGTEYRDDIEDMFGVEAIGVLHATANGINPSTMHFTVPNAAADNVSDDIFKAHFADGWSSPDKDYDGEPDDNEAVHWGNVTQHYAAQSQWRYNLGSDRDPSNPGQPPPDFTDGGWGPHVLNATIDQINAKLMADGKPTLSKDGIPSSSASRVNRISRLVRW